jgi:iron complex outermembrane receptor protein
MIPATRPSAPRTVRIALGGLLLPLALAAPARAAPQPQRSPQEETAAGERPALSESLVFDDVPEVFSASRYLQPASEAPASVTALAGDTLRGQGVRTVGEALRLAPGLFMHYDRIYEFAGFRGFALPGDFNTRILVLLDGHTLNNSVVTGGSNIGTDLGIDMTEVERIEIIRGPASSLYGGNAFLGTINIVTRRPVVKPGVDTALRYGSFGRLEAAAAWSGGFSDGGEMWVGARLQDIDGDSLYFPDYDDPLTNDGTAERSDFDRAWSGRALYRRGGFSLSAYAAARDKGLPTAPFATTFNSRLNRNRDFRAFVDASYRWALRPDLSVQARGYVDRYQFDDFLDYSSSGGGLFRDNGEDSFVGAEGQIDWRTGKRQHWLGGFTFENHHARQVSGERGSPPNARDLREYYLHNLFVQDEIRASGALTLVLGAHLHSHELFESRLSPRVAAVLTPKGKTRWKLLYNEGFRSPTLFEAFFEDGLDFIANADLRPETVRTGEVVLERPLGKRLQLQASAYRSKARDLIQQIEVDIDPGAGTDFRSQFQNIYDASAYGIETGLDFRIGSTIGGSASAVYQRVTSDATGRRLVNSPAWVANLLLEAPVRGLFTAALHAQYVGRRATEVPLPDGASEVDDYALVNLTLRTQRLLPGCEVALSAYNLFDADYDDPVAPDHLPLAAARQDGRAFRLSIQRRF